MCWSNNSLIANTSQHSAVAGTSKSVMCAVRSSAHQRTVTSGRHCNRSAPFVTAGPFTGTKCPGSTRTLCLVVARTPHAVRTKTHTSRAQKQPEFASFPLLFGIPGGAPRKRQPTNGILLDGTWPAVPQRVSWRTAGHRLWTVPGCLQSGLPASSAASTARARRAARRAARATRATRAWSRPSSPRAAAARPACAREALPCGTCSVSPIAFVTRCHAGRSCRSVDWRWAA